MTPIFKKWPTPEELFAQAMEHQGENNVRQAKFGMALSRCKRKDRELGRRIIGEVIKISDDPVRDLKHLFTWARDNELARCVVDEIARYGWDRPEVRETLESIGSGSVGNRAGRRRARRTCERFSYGQMIDRMGLR